MTTPVLQPESFTGTANGTGATLEKHFNLSVSGTFVGTVEIQRSYDGISGTYHTIKAYTVPIEETGIEPEGGIFYRMACTAFTSGTIVTRLGQTPPT